ncbi:hypothetical protein QUF80_05000 [Desulfococcaceae bacterium HSG8]|nr:hypothetical protein [Desulfococcaceae bacterium HSG8]
MNPSEKHTDPFEIAASFQKMCSSWVQNPQKLNDMLTELNSDICDIYAAELDRLLSENESSEKTGRKKDVFMDTVKQYSNLARKYHSVYSGWLKDFVEKAPEAEGKDKQRSIFWTRQMINALAPSNYFWTNPGAVQKFIKTEGDSLNNGYQNWMEDIRRGNYLPEIADEEAFNPGENIAATPGYVVFRNELTEVIQYAPTTQTAYAVPIVLIQPWINKFYIFDLNKQSSFVRYLLNEGFTVFITSWKNPDSDMRHISFDDYMLRGVLKTIEVAKEICNTDKVHAAGYCIGGTALTALMAWLNREPAQEDSFPVADWTLFSTMTDFSEPGELGVFISEKSIESIEALMTEDGYLDGKYLELVFRLLRSDSLIWRYIAHNYLQGGAPPKSDMLYWNSDSTRLPEAMCSFYLREFYLHNRLSQKDGLTLGGRPIDMGYIDQPLYAVGAQQDHISPWKETFRTCHMVMGPVRYVLANEGHIAGIVNPPSARSRKKYWAGGVHNGLKADAWLSAQEESRGSWWPDWVEWLSERSGAMGKPPSAGCETYPCLEKAPGQYVIE